jgi:hypothetical protein
MAKWVVWASSGGPRESDDEKRALFYVEADYRAAAAELVEGMDLATDLMPGQRAKVSNQPTTDTGALKRRP